MKRQTLVDCSRRLGSDPDFRFDVRVQIPVEVGDGGSTFEMAENGVRMNLVTVRNFEAQVLFFMLQ